MAIKDCIDEIRRIAGDKLSESEIAQIAAEVDRRAKARRAKDASVSEADALAQAAKDMSGETTAAKKIEMRNRALDLVRSKARSDFYDQAVKDGYTPAQAIRAKMAGIERDMRGGGNSTDARGKAIEGFFLGGLAGDLRKSGVLKLFTQRLGVLGDGAGIADRDLNRALWSIGDNGKVTIDTSPDIKNLAEAMHKWMELARQRENRAGAWIRKDPNYIARQSWDMAKIRAMGKQRFIQFMLPLLDHEKTFGAKDPTAFLDKAYDALSTGVFIKADGGESAFKGMGNLAKRVSAERSLYFKDADSFTTANEAIGLNSTAEAIIAQLRRAGRNVAMMEDWGTNPRYNFDADVRMLQEKYRDNPTWTDQLGAKSLGDTFSVLDGSVNIADNASGANIARNIRGLQDVAKLPLASLSHLNILATAASELRHEGESLGEAYADFLGSFVENASGADRNGLIADLGVAYESMAGTIAARFSASDQTAGSMTRVLRSYFKLNGMRFAIETSRSAFGQTLAANLGRDAKLKFDKLPEAKRILLGHYGIDAAKWDVLRQGVAKLADGRTYMSPDHVASLPDEAFTPLGAKNPIGAQRLRDDLATTLRAYIMDRTDHAVPTPGARERAIMTRGTSPGTLEGEAYRFIWQFKQFPLTLWSKVVQREIGKFQDGRGDILGVAHFVAATTLMGMFAMQAKQMLKARTPRDPFSGNWPAVWTAALEQGGGAGIYGDFLFSQVSDTSGGGTLSALAGPALGDLGQTLDTLKGLTQTRRDKDGNLEPITGQADLLRLAANNMPNLFYTRVALDYLVLYQLQEMASPGYLKRMENRLKQQSNQTMFLPPSTVIPHGGGRLFTDNRLLNGSALQ